MATDDARKLFVAGLPDSISEDVLRDLFTATGVNVVSVSLPKDRTTGRPRGFGFVTLATAEEAQTARSSLDGSFQAGRPISVRPFQSEPPRRDQRSEREPISGAPGGGPGGGGGGGPGAGGAEDRTLYVGNLPYDTSQAEVERLFSERGAGPVVRVHLPAGPDGRLRGFGFVSFGSAEAANGAIAALRDVEVRGRRLMINIAHPRGERPAGGPRSPGGGGMGPGGPRWDPGMPPPPADARAGERRPRGAAEREEEDWAQKKKKRKRGPTQSEDPKVSHGNWQKWEDWDED